MHIIAEIAASAKASGGSISTMLEDMYLEFGVWHEDMKSIVIEGKAGQEEISQMMKDFRSNPPELLGGSKVAKVLDYQSLIETDKLNNTNTKLEFPSSNVLQFVTETGYKVSVRPSGTEPKIKFYFSVSEKVENRDQIESTKQKLVDLVAQIKQELNLPS